jgi:hypothetical protein
MATEYVSVSGGDKAIKALEAIITKMGDGSVEVGFMKEAKYPDGTPVAAVAYWQDMGTPSIPPRPFFRNMVKEDSPGWPEIMARTAKQAKFNGPIVLDRIGEKIEGDLRKSIIDTEEPALSPVTLMLRKMFGNQPQNITFDSVMMARAKVAAGQEGATGTQAHPLIWTGHMMNSITHRVTP